MVLLLVGLRSLEETRNPGAPAIDIPGTVLSVLGVGALTYGLIEGGARGWTSPMILGSFTAAIILLAAFVAVEARHSAPMLPLRLFRQRLFTVSNTAMVVVGFALMGSSFFFSQFFVYVQGSSILRAGLQTLPVSLAMVAVSPFAGHLAARYGFRIVVTTGLALAGLGLLALGMVHADTGYGNVWWRLGVIGTGFALTLSPLTGAAIQAVSPQEGGLASGVSSTTRQIGAVLGVAVLGVIVRTRQSGGASFETGLNSAFVAAGAITLATAVFTGLWLARSEPAERSVAPQRSPIQMRSPRRTRHPRKAVDNNNRLGREVSRRRLLQRDTSRHTPGWRPAPKAIDDDMLTFAQALKAKGTPRPRHHEEAHRQDRQKRLPTPLRRVALPGARRGRRLKESEMVFKPRSMLQALCDVCGADLVDDEWDGTLMVFDTEKEARGAARH